MIYQVRIKESRPFQGFQIAHQVFPGRVFGSFRLRFKKIRLYVFFGKLLQFPSEFLRESRQFVCAPRLRGTSQPHEFSL